MSGDPRHSRTAAVAVAGARSAPPTIITHWLGSGDVICDAMHHPPIPSPARSRRSGTIEVSHFTDPLSHCVCQAASQEPALTMVAVELLVFCIHSSCRFPAVAPTATEPIMNAGTCVPPADPKLR